MIVGDFTFDYYAEKLKRMSDDRVIFAGHIPHSELPFYYAACDIYATCSLWENHNLPVEEAQACGKPVVAFDIGPHREVINNNGILVEEEDVEKFSAACVKKLRRARAR